MIDRSPIADGHALRSGRRMPTLYKHVAILEVAEASQLDELLVSGLRSLVVRQLSPTAVVVDHERVGDVRKLLKKLGETPRITPE
jgi:hypothetical protein